MGWMSEKPKAMIRSFRASNSSEGASYHSQTLKAQKQQVTEPWNSVLTLLEVVTFHGRTKPTHDNP